MMETSISHGAAKNSPDASRGGASLPQRIFPRGKKEDYCNCRLVEGRGINLQRDLFLAAAAAALGGLEASSEAASMSGDGGEVFGTRAVPRSVSSRPSGLAARHLC